MFRIEANLENRFASLDEALAAFSTERLVQPCIPDTRNENEDATTPRISVAPTIENCLTGIGLLGRFRRTLSANEDAYSYAVDGDEAYPVIVLEFDDEDVYKPTTKEVPDVRRSHEHWFLTPKKPKSVSLKQLDMFSVRWRDGNHPETCRKVTFVDDPTEYNHPWLNGKGHILESSRMEDEDQDEIRPFIRPN